MKAFVIRNFTDAGDGKSFTASKNELDTVDIEDGAFANYAASGLVRKPADPAALKDAAGSKSQTAASA